MSDEPFNFAPRRRFDPETAAARKVQQVRRNSRAQSLAMRELAKRHPAEYVKLKRLAQAKVDADAGPLPGDEQ